MRRIVKLEDSEAKDLVYKVGGNNSKIRSILLKEQKHICAYTETYFVRISTEEIEHFNPTLKGTNEDGYHNYFLVQGQWNNEKGTAVRWQKFQPLLHPTDEDFEQRVKYKGGTFVCNEGDVEAKNLIGYLKLDDNGLKGYRLRYIERHRELVRMLADGNAEKYFSNLLESSPEEVYFIRAIQEEFDIQLNL